MVKADFTRDYYADLELPPGADVNDVKKAFRKLGTLWSEPVLGLNELSTNIRCSSQIPS